MAEQDWTAFADDTVLADTDILLIVRGAGGINLPGSALIKKDASGNVGVGTASPLARLDVRGNLWVRQADASYFELNSSSTVADLIFANTGGLRFVNNATERLRIEASGHVSPGADNAQNIGSGSLRFAVVYAGTGSINTSDEREKKNIGDIPDAWLEAWEAVKWQRFKFKGGNRWHIGLVAQQVHSAFAAHNLDAFEIGLCCFDKWDEEIEPIFETVKKTRKVKRETGDLTNSGKPKTETVDEEFEESVDTGKTRVRLPAGDRWGLRYDECQALEAAYQRRRIERLEKLVASLQE